MLRYRTQGFLAVNLGLGILAAGCLSEPDLKTGLRPEGPPEVLAVLAVDATTAAEVPAFCKYVGGVLDEKGPGLVQGTTVCPDVAADFESNDLAPLGWDVRIVFDELLNPDKVEELVCDADGDGEEDAEITVCEGSLLTGMASPITLRCGTTTVPNGGYYYPNGNKESFPVGPAIYVSPDRDALTFATGTTCTISVNDVVVDKSGEKVATGAQLNSFDLKIADLAVVTSQAAADDPEAVDADGAVTFLFNANLLATSVTAADFEVVNSTGTVVPTTVVVDDENGDTDAVRISAAAPTGFAAGTYTARLKSGAVFTEVNGGMLTLTANNDVRFVVE